MAWAKAIPLRLIPTMDEDVARVHPRVEAGSVDHLRGEDLAQVADVELPRGGDA